MKRLLKHAASDTVHTITLERTAASDDACEARIGDRAIADEYAGYARLVLCQQLFSTRLQCP